MSTKTFLSVFNSIRTVSQGCKHANLPGRYLTIFIGAITASFYTGLAFFFDDSLPLSLIFFGLAILFSITVFSEFIQPLNNKIDRLQIKLCEINEKLSSIETSAERARERIEALEGIKQRPGFVYIMKRDDGIVKIGRSIDTEKRLKQHVTDYGCKFSIIETFVVPDAITFEYLALSMTTHCAFLEPHRNELRSMSDEEIAKFRATFIEICKEAVVLR
jgi:hypothetical protein